MKTVKIKISLLGYWYIGTGHEAGAYADSIALKDRDNLPFIPGKTLKGMFRNSAQLCCNNSILTEDEMDVLFGVPGTSLERPCDNNDLDNDELATSGILHFNNAELTGSEKNEIKEQDLSRHLYKIIQSTAIDKNGVAADKSLRSCEVVVPLNFITSISYEDNQKFNDTFESEDKLKELLKTLASFITEIGGKRRRGFGRCLVEVL